MRAYPYNNAAVRDLAWACFEPPLMNCQPMTVSSPAVNNCGLEFTQARQHWLEQLDRDPSALREYLAGIRSRRLGLYFEALWHFFLQSDDNVELVAHNLPVREHGITLGEFDCIYYCHSRRRHFHLELAVKYFLGIRGEPTSPADSQWHQWWGPECQDRLDLKLRHLLDHQIQLGNTAAGRASLAELGVREVSREIEMKGYLFTSEQDPLPPPLAYNRDRAMSTWLPVNELPGHAERSEWPLFLILPKSQWLSPVALDDSSEGLNASQLQDNLGEHFEHQIRPQLVAALDAHGREMARFFVVDDHWPATDGTKAAQLRPR